MHELTKEHGGKRKDKGYSFVKQRNRRNKRRQEAEARNKAWSQLSREEQIKILGTRRGESKRQIARIKAFNTNR